MAKRTKTTTNTQAHHIVQQSQQQWNGKPVPSDIVIIRPEIPIYTGDIATDRPMNLDQQIHMKLMTVPQRVGLNRVFAAIERMALRDDSMPAPKQQEFPPWMRKRPEVARWVFALIAEEFERQSQ